MTITVQNPEISKPLTYVEDNNPDKTPVKMRICKIPVTFNGSMTEATAHCLAIDGIPPIDDAPLKWANVTGNSRILVRGLKTYLGLFEIRDNGIVLHTNSDTFPRKPSITEPGTHKLDFQIDSADHCMVFSVTVNYADYTVSLGG